MTDTILMKIHRLLQAFNLRDLQNFRNFITVMGNYDFTIEDTLRYIGVRELSKGLNYYKGCPNCGSSLQAWGINDQPCNQVAGEWKSMWFCDRCEYDKYSALTLGELKEQEGIILEDISLPLAKRNKIKGCGGCGQTKR